MSKKDDAQYDYYVHSDCILDYMWSGPLAHVVAGGWGQDTDNAVTCHLCIQKPVDERRTTKPDMVVYDDIMGHLCDCGARSYGTPHEGHDKVWLDLWWAQKREYGETEGEGSMYVCAECWYEDNDMPPDEREDRPDGANCQNCDDYVKEVIRIPRGKQEGTVTTFISDDDDDEDEDTPIPDVELYWTRKVVYIEYYSHTIRDLDREDIEMMEDDPDSWQEMLHDVAHDESDDSNRTDREFYGYEDGECPEVDDWHVV